MSLGFTQTGRVSITVAAENNKNAQNTYKKNHPNVEVLDDVRQIDYAEILKQVKEAERLRKNSIDIGHHRQARRRVLHPARHRPLGGVLREGDRGRGRIQ